MTKKGVTNVRIRQTCLRNELEHTEVFTPPDVGGKPPVTLTGRIANCENKRKFVLVMPARNDSANLALEIDLHDVLEEELVFQDSAGRKSYRVRVPANAVVKAIIRAADVERSVRVEERAAYREEPVAPWNMELGHSVETAPMSRSGFYEEAAFGPPA